MARVFDKLGRLSYIHPRVLLSAWIAVFLSLGLLAASYGRIDQLSESSSSDTQARMDARLEKLFPGSVKGYGYITLEPVDGGLIEDYRPEVLRLASQLERSGYVGSVATLFDEDRLLSSDGKVGLIEIGLSDRSAGALEQLSRHVDEQLALTNEMYGLEAHKSGDLNDPSDAYLLSSLSVVAIISILALLIVAFGSLLVGSVIVLSSVLGVGAGVLTLIVAGGVVGVNINTLAYSTVVGLAASVALTSFVVNRFRASLVASRGTDDAIGSGVGRSGVIALLAGLTLLLGLAAAQALGLPQVAEPVAGLAVVVAFIVMAVSTLTPALLGLAFGRGMVSGRELSSARGDSTDGVGDIGSRLSHVYGLLVASRGVVVSLALVGVLFLTAVASRIDLGLELDRYAGVDSSYGSALGVIERSFGSSGIDDVMVVVDGVGSIDVQGIDVDSMEASLKSTLDRKSERVDIDELAQEREMEAGEARLRIEPWESIDGSAEVGIGGESGEVKSRRSDVERSRDKSIGEDSLRAAVLADGFMGIDGVADVEALAVSPDSQSMLLRVVLEGGLTEREAVRVHSAIYAGDVSSQLSSLSDIHVRGFDSQRLDAGQAGGLSGKLLEFSLVLIVAYAIATLVTTRRLLVSVVATLGVAVALLAAVASSVAVFQSGWFSFSQPVSEGVRYALFVAAVAVTLLSFVYVTYLAMSTTDDASGPRSKSLRELLYREGRSLAAVFTACLLMLGSLLLGASLYASAVGVAVVAGFLGVVLTGSLMVAVLGTSIDKK